MDTHIPFWNSLDKFVGKIINTIYSSLERDLPQSLVFGSTLGENSPSPLHYGTEWIFIETLNTQGFIKIKNYWI